MISVRTGKVLERAVAFETDDKPEDVSTPV